MGTIAPIKDQSILMTGILILDMMVLVLVCIDFWAGVIHRLRFQVWAPSNQLGGTSREQ